MNRRYSSDVPPFNAQWKLGNWPLWLFFVGAVFFALKDVPAVFFAMLGDAALLSPQASSLLSMTLLLLLALLAARFAPGPFNAASLGLVGGEPKRMAAWGVAALVALYIPVVLGDALSQSGSQDVTGLLGEGWVNQVCMVLTMAAIGPVAEELAYRAVLFRAAADGLARWLSPTLAAGIAMLASAAVFALVHIGAPPWQMAAYFAFGLVLAAAYWHTGSLLACLIPHLLNNAYVAIKMALQVQANQTMVLAAAVLSPLVGLALAWCIGQMLGASRDGATRQSSTAI